MPPCDSSVRYFLVKIEPPGQQTFSYSPKLNLSTALGSVRKVDAGVLGPQNK